MPLDSQFHHYVPQFILRKWSTVKITRDWEKRVKKGKRFRTIKGTREEDVISTYDQVSDILLVDATPVASCYGFTNLYKDEGEEDPYHIEKLFSKLESQSAVVIKKLDDASGHITLPRRDLNTLRKFLFLLTYRNSSRSKQFLEDKFDPVTRKEVETFRLAHGLKDFRAVWMLNIRNILLSEHWEVTTNPGILYSDRCLYLAQMQQMRLGMFRAPEGCQFILTENGFGLFDGTDVEIPPEMDAFFSPDTPPRSHYTHPHTNTYAISPTLALMLRNPLTVPEQDGETSPLARVFGQFLSESWFSDFPRTRAEVIYSPPLSPSAVREYMMDSIKPPSVLVGSQEEMLRLPSIGGRPIQSRLGDKFTFQIHRLTKAQAEKANMLLLTNNWGVITFKSASALLSSIEVYEKDCPLWSHGQIGGQPRYGKVPFGSLKRQLREAIATGVGGNVIGTLVPPAPVASPSLNTPLDPIPTDQSVPKPEPLLALPAPPSSTSNTAPAQVVQDNVSISTSLPGLRGAFSRVSKQKSQPLLTPSPPPQVPPLPLPPSPGPPSLPVAPPPPESVLVLVDSLGEQLRSIPGAFPLQDDEMAHSLMSKDARLYYLSLLLWLVFAVLYAPLVSGLYFRVL